jgi:hypothetical protein
MTVKSGLSESGERAALAVVLGPQPHAQDACDAQPGVFGRIASVSLVEQN